MDAARWKHMDFSVGYVGPLHFIYMYYDIYYDMKRRRIVQNETFLLIAQTRSVDKQFSKKKKLKAELFCL